ncbi:MAG: DAK2 domain-containing protein [Chloroflexota bacterium]|nr:DAK2 domain-containing protein [Chloroflexota bacterium]
MKRSHQSGKQEVTRLDGQDLKRLLEASLIWLEGQVDFINSLNVYPVPDGDTGTNMLLTMQSALKEISKSSDHSAAAIAKAASYGALMGARGNSGVILSQLLRGVARSLEGKGDFDASDLAAALQEASVTAYKGVLKPVEGTILTVAKDVARVAATAVEDDGDFGYVLERVVSEAERSVARTPSLLPVLAEAGVVDAGGQGLYALLEGALRCIQGEVMERAPTFSMVEAEAPTEGGYGYDTQFILKGESLDVEKIRKDISTMGDCVLVVGDSSTIKVHLHTHEPGAPINYAVRLGSVSDVVVEDMQAQYEEFTRKRPPLPSKKGEIAVVAVVLGEGLERICQSLGADAVVVGGQTMNPSTKELLEAIKNLGSDKVIILPNNENVVLTANQAGALSEKEVRVVPTRTIPQGIGALLAFDPTSDLEANLEAMEQAAGGIHTGEVTRAIRATQVNGVEVKEGEIIGLLDGGLVASGPGLDDVAHEIIRRMTAVPRELITLYYGKEVARDQAEGLAAGIRQRYPDLEVEVIEGGQPYYHYILSAE